MSTNLLNHIAFIMDGNQRWAKENKISLSVGYNKGLDKLNEILNFCIDKDIKYLSVYALSSENIKRNSINLIYSLIVKKNQDFNQQLINEKKVKINFVGDRDELPKKIINIFENLEESTKHNKKITLNIVFNYGYLNEISHIFKNINSAGGINLNKKNFLKLINKYKYLSPMPDPDLLIRTGGYQRLSNFLMLNISYTELFFSHTLWPSFSIVELKKIIDKYKNMQRNHGL